MRGREAATSGKAQSRVQGLNFRYFPSANQRDISWFPWQLTFSLLLLLLLFLLLLLLSSLRVHTQTPVRAVGALHLQRNWKENRSPLKKKKTGFFGNWKGDIVFPAAVVRLLKLSGVAAFRKGKAVRWLVRV